MKVKYFSIYKSNYIFGFMNLPIIIIIIVILSNIPCDNKLCKVENKEKNYKENIKNIIYNEILSIDIIFIISSSVLYVLYGLIGILINLILYNYTIFHLIIFTEIFVLISNNFMQAKMKYIIYFIFNINSNFFYISFSSSNRT